LGKRPQRPGPLLPLVVIALLLVVLGVAAYSKFSNSEPPQSKVLAPPLDSQSIIGQASVVDGDTIEIHGTRIRLFGIDAPEGDQTCTLQGKPVRCGQQAANALADKIKTHTVECRPKDKDRYDRPVAVCFVAGEDINRWMVSVGWALAYRQYSMDYVDQERDASSSKLGIWKFQFEKPWDWRGNHAERKTPPRVENNLSKSQRPNGQHGAVYYPPGDLSGRRYQTMVECDQARQQAGNVGVCLLK